ncbi:unnamed protein product [Leptidea sinapis]|uniref:SLC26A/SulP transporter domain-containing protein n=1 Tax=Leptidea sinapis TaxID=189913 RepID=A0A5E4QI02_9NEOP|nr:unnamed protein product [Leptidea sinapis]
MPITGSFSRSAVNHASGVASQLGSILVLLALSLLTPYFYYIPKASLAAVIICALGIVAGVMLNVLLLLYPSARPQLEAEIVTVPTCW